MISVSFLRITPLRPGRRRRFGAFIPGGETGQMPQVEVNGARLHYQETGQGDQTVVFSHSFLLSSRHFHYQIEALAERYRCLAFDHRGHGRSQVTADGYGLENLYADALGFLEAVAGGPCHFVGLSTGGFIGLRLAIRRPELLRSLVLMDTTAEAEDPAALGQYKLMVQVVRWLGWRPVMGRIMPMFFADQFLQDPARREEAASYRAEIMANDRAAMRQFALGIMARESVLEQLGAVDLPCLVLAGEEDQPASPDYARRMAGAIAGARLELIPGAGHISTVDQPQAVTKALTDFLAANS